MICFVIKPKENIFRYLELIPQITESICNQQMHFSGLKSPTNYLHKQSHKICNTLGVKKAAAAECDLIIAKIISLLTSNSIKT